MHWTCVDNILIHNRNSWHPLRCINRTTHDHRVCFIRWKVQVAVPNFPHSKCTPPPHQKRKTFPTTISKLSPRGSTLPLSGFLNVPSDIENMKRLLNTGELSCWHWTISITSDVTNLEKEWFFGHVTVVFPGVWTSSGALHIFEKKQGSMKVLLLEMTTEWN